MSRQKAPSHSSVACANSPNLTCRRSTSRSASPGRASTTRTVSLTQADGKVARISPLIPGIDLAGEVVASDEPAIAVGAAVLVHGYELGVPRHGGYAEYQRVPGDWVVPLGAGLSPRDAMAIGTAGFTAAMSVVALEERGLRTGVGPVLGHGRHGGVGGTAVAILADRGYEVWAATGKPDEAERLRGLGAVGILSRDEVTAPGPAARIGAVGGRGRCSGAATLPYVLRTLRVGASVASSGNAGGAELATTVFPFILRGVSLLGMDSVARPDRAPPRAVGSARNRPATARPRRSLQRGHSRHAGRRPRWHPRGRGPWALGRPNRRLAGRDADRTRGLRSPQNRFRTRLSWIGPRTAL